MGMGKGLVLAWVLVLVLWSSSWSSNGEKKIEVELRQYGFPVGLVPNNVKRYSVNGSSGEFWVELEETCRVRLPPDNYLATYSKRITGNIVHSRISHLNGITVRAFFKSWPITGIRSKSHLKDLVFELGMLTANYPSHNFNSTPACHPSSSSS